MKIFLVRHGQDEDNARGILNGRRDMPLTKFGSEQAYAVAQKLKEYDIEVIYTSPLLRAYQTAQIISDVIAVDKVVVDQHLIERDFGVLTGRPVTDIPRYADKIIVSDKVNYFIEAKNAESFSALYYRAQEILNKIQKRHPDSTILIVAHGDIGKMIRGVHYGLNWEESLQTPFFSNAGILELFDHPHLYN